MIHELWKYSIQEGATSQVSVGQKASSKTIKVIREVKPSEIKQGDEVYVGSDWTNFIKTSPVARVEECSDGSLTIWTQTSVYKLESKNK